MSVLGIFGIAYDSNLRHTRYDAWGAHPQFDNYIESVYPEAAQSFETNGNFVKIDTTHSDAVVIAAEQIVLPNGDVRKFSYWLLDSDADGKTDMWAYKILPVHKGEFGLVGLYYGAPVLPHPWQLRALRMQQLVDTMVSKNYEGVDLSKLEKEFEITNK